MNYRTRRENKAARLAEWATKREVKAEALQNTHTDLRHDWQFITQPGISKTTAWKRMNARDDKAREIAAKGKEMAQRAGGITDQLAHAIYSDAPDAIQALVSRIAALEAEQASIKAFNAEVRKGKGDPAKLAAAIKTHLSAELRASFMSVMRHQSYYKPELKGFPPYGSSNLSANIRRNRERLEQLRNA